jgi:ABC-type uncharacterized transport system involved in gliding motility auxiliary subunit
MSNRGFISLIALIGAVALFFTINIIADKWLTGARADLTEGKLYTLSPGSRNIAKGLQEPVKLTLYLTQKAANDEPLVKPYAQRVREMLDEFVRASNGKLTLTIIDPEPFSENQDKADAAGVKPFQIRGGKNLLYFGLVGTNAVDKTEVIPLLDPGREAFLEFDLAKMIFNLSDRPRSTIGLMTWLPIEGAEGNPMMQGRGQTPPWQIDKKFKEAFDVKPIATNAKEIPTDIKVLVIVHPKTMSDQTQYAVDQFVMRGGRVLLFVDPNCYVDVPPGMNQFQAMQVPKASDLERLMNAWGVEMEAGKVAADSELGIIQPEQRGNRQENQKRITWLSLDKSRRSATDPVTSQLELAFVVDAGVLKKKEGATTDVQPLLMTGKKAAPIDASKVSVFPDWKKLEAEFQEGSKELWLAVRASGNAKSAFPDGPPSEAPIAPGEKAEKTPPPPSHLAESKEPINVIVVADADFLNDMCWIQPLTMQGVTLGYNEISDNGVFAVNAVENLTGSTDLLSLRARGKAARPFTKIKALEDEAQKQYSKEQDHLEKTMRDLDQQISDLLKQRPDGKDSRIVLTPDLQKKIFEAREKKLETRKKLREVQFNLDKDVRALKNRIMFYDIGLMPIVVGLFAIGLGAYRGFRRKMDRQSASKG